MISLVPRKIIQPSCVGRRHMVWVIYDSLGPSLVLLILKEHIHSLLAEQEAGIDPRDTRSEEVSRDSSLVTLKGICLS